MALATLPPGPKGHYLTGNLLDYARDPLDFLSRCSREYGDVVRLRLPGLPLYLLNNPDDVEQVLVKNNRAFVKSRYFRRELGFLGKGLLNSEGEFWRRQRRLAQPTFHRRRINAYGEVMVSYTERMLATWRAGEIRDIHQEMMRLLLEIVAKVLFDAEIAESREVREALDRAVKRFDEQGSGMLVRFLLGNFPTPTNLRFRRAVGRLDEVIYGIIDERRSSGKDTGDLLSMLLHAQDEEGNQMSNRQLRDEVITLLLAGHETNALALSWTWYLLSRHPEVETKLLDEFREVLGDRAPTVDDVPRLRYAEMVIKESMRLYPPAWGLSREAAEECEIGGYRVPAGTQLFIVLWVLHRDPRYFEDPETFHPERWEDGSAKRTPKYAYLPFGAGPRLCIGSSFAMTEAILLLATVAKSFRLKLASEQPVIPQPSVTLRPGGGMRMVLKRTSSDAWEAGD
jgi:cytochrome P450